MTLRDVITTTLLMERCRICSSATRTVDLTSSPPLTSSPAPSFHAATCTRGSRASSSISLAPAHDRPTDRILSLLDRCNPWPHVANRHISISQSLSSCCYLFTVSNSGLLSVQRPRPASHAHFCHSHIPEIVCGVNSSIDSVFTDLYSP